MPADVNLLFGIDFGDLVIANGAAYWIARRAVTPSIFLDDGDVMVMVACDVF